MKNIIIFHRYFSQLLLKFSENLFCKPYIGEYFYNFQLPVFILSKLQAECKSDKKSREHRQKTFVMLSELWPLRGWGVLGESIKKGIFVTKIFFQIMLK